MKKLLILLTILIMFVNFGWSQNGYREFTWGMTINEVRDICIQKNTYWVEHGSDFGGIGSNAHFAIIYYLDSVLFFNFPFLPGIWYFGNITDNEGGMFHFYNGRLTTVLLSRYNGGIQALNTRYGNGRRIEFQASSFNGSPATIWLENRQRYIVFFKNRNYGYDCVAYVDANWINLVYNNVRNEIHEREDQSRSLID